MSEFSLFCRISCAVCGLCVLACFDITSKNPLDSASERSISGVIIPQMTTPAGGEQWFPGTTRTIRWIPATGIDDSLVTLQLVREGAASGPVMIADAVPNTGTYTWTIPDLPAPECRIRVVGSVGFSESPLPFAIKATPVTSRLSIGGEGREPAAMRTQIVFTSARSGNDDLWLYDRSSGALQQLTLSPGFDGHAAFFKSGGLVIAFTSDRTGQKNIWGMTMEGAGAFTPFQITNTGGEQPAWQNTGSMPNPSLAYKELSNTQSTFIAGVTLNTATAEILQIRTPVTFLRGPVRMIDATLGSVVLINIGRPSWGWHQATGADMLVFDSGVLDA